MGITCFTPPPSVFKYSICARFRDVVHVSEMLCTFPRSCACFTEVVHVSQQLCTFHKPPNNVRVQLYTHWAHSNRQKHWGDRTRSPDVYTSICMYNYILYMYISCSRPPPPAPIWYGRLPLRPPTPPPTPDLTTSTGGEGYVDICVYTYIYILYTFAHTYTHTLHTYTHVTNMYIYITFIYT